MKKLFTSLSIFLVALTLFPADLFAQAEFDNTALNVVVNNYGRIRVFSTGADPKQIERISPLVGGADGQVFDYQNDMENEVPSVLVESPTLSDFEIFGAFNNTYTNLPPNVLVEMNLFAWTGQPYFIVKYTITNRETADLTAVPGVEVIPELDGGYGGDVTNYIADAQATITTRDGSTKKLGIKILSHTLTTLEIGSYVSDYWVGDTDLYGWLTSGTIDATGTAGVDGALIIFGGPGIVLPTNGTATFYVAAAVEGTDEAVLGLLTEAQNKYNTTFTSVEPGSIPVKYELSQNFPNPFNPTTKINFSIPQNDFVSLRIYNTLGQEVAHPVANEMSAGNHSVEFNASYLSSGAYFYVLTAGNFNSTRKMILIK
ncbi:MAG: T9SS type A sorting domain-containing protein [bacterium]